MYRLADYIPLEGKCGSVLVTSQADLTKSGLNFNQVIHLKPLKSEECLQIWDHMNVVSQKVQTAVEIFKPFFDGPGEPETDDELKAACSKTGGAVVYTSPPQYVELTEAEKQQIIAKKKKKVSELQALKKESESRKKAVVSDRKIWANKLRKALLGMYDCCF